MKKDIKDYLHLYFGCGVIGYPYFKNTMEAGNHPVKGKLVGLKMDYGIIEYVDRNGYKWNELRNEIFQDFKLLLRPLQHIERKEVEHLLWLVLDSPRLGRDCRISKEEAANSIDSIEPDDKAVVVNISLRCFEGKLYISEHSGNLRLYDDIDKELPIEWNPEIFRYLLSKGFDLFNLLEKGLALSHGDHLAHERDATEAKSGEQSAGNISNSSVGNKSLLEQ